ncbi:uncharacterized protein LOC123274269 [Cotesia glomerata]|uniref:uncharacterized protein LOC123274269 n=1 Tax=Cotesia glomerata TaxID=32391 RepID=UPI001D006919|nr:uncharacterized protein LOC123274269 [Cotesia glomerata]
MGRLERFQELHELKKMDVGIPVLFVLCSLRTKALYNTIWEFIIARVNGIQNRLQRVVIDFEAAIISSIKETFPLVRIRGCWFHCLRAMTRKWNSLRLPQGNDKTLKLAWALSLLPPQLFHEAIGIIVESAERIEAEHPNVSLFIYYLYNQWLPLADIVSV